MLSDLTGGEGMGEIASGGTYRHGIQDEGLTYTQTIFYDKNKVKQARIGDTIATTGTATTCPNLLQDVLVFYKKLAKRFGRVIIVE